VSAPTVITRRYTVEGLAVVRGKVNDLLRKADKKGWNADAKIEAGEPFLYTDDDAIHGKRTFYMVDATITFTGHFGFDGGWALVAVADARSTDEPLVFLLDEEFTPGDIDLKRCDHCGRRAARKRAHFIRSAAGEVKQVGGSCAHEYLGVNLFSAIDLYDAFTYDPDEDDFPKAARLNIFDVNIVLDCAIRAYSAFGYAKRDAEYRIPTKDIVTAMLTGTFWHKSKYAEERATLSEASAPTVTSGEVRAWMLEQDGTGEFGNNMAVIARSEQVGFGALGLAAYAPAGFDDWRGKMAEEAKRRQEEEARRATAAPVPTGKVDIEGTVAKVAQIETQYGRALKVRVVNDAGWAVWGTLPKSINRVEVGERVRFTATVTASPEDELFGFYKRPTNAEVIA
jgi:hypothetical protein